MDEPKENAQTTNETTKEEPKDEISDLKAKRNKCEEKIDQIKKKIEEKQKCLQDAWCEYDEVCEKISKIIKQTGGGATVPKSEPESKGGRKRGLSKAILDFCETPRTRAEILEHIKDRFYEKSLDSTLYSLQKQGSKGRKLVKKEGATGEKRYETTTIKPAVNQKESDARESGEGPGKHDDR